MNVYPTVCELAGLPVPEHVKGRSLTPLLRDPKATWDGVAICTHGRGNHAVRDAQWRYIRYADGSEELYDHSKDPYEWTNLAGEVGFSPIKEKLAQWLPVADAEVKPVPKGEAGSDDEGGAAPKAGKNKGKGNAKKKSAK